MRLPRLRAALDAAAGPLVTVLLTVVATVQAMSLWQWRPGIPIATSSDASQVIATARAVIDHGIYAPEPRLGAPFGQNVGWFTTGDYLNFATIRLFGQLTGSAQTATAALFLLGFPAAALSAYWLARRLHLGRPGSVVAGVLFGMLPGHQVWFAHLWLAGYWVLPFGVWLVVEVARGHRLWPGRHEWRESRSLAWRLAARTGGSALAVGLADVYYVAFTLLLLAVALGIRFWGARDTEPSPLSRLAPGALVLAAVGVPCGLSLVAATRSRSADLVTGAPPAQRIISESETYAGKLIELALPWQHHRVPALSFLRSAYDAGTTASVERPALGVVALVAVVALLGSTLVALASRRPVGRLTGVLAALTVVSLGFYTRGGLGSVFALFVTPQIRTWSRFVVLIALFGLLVVAGWVTRVGQRRGRVASWTLAAFLLVVGVLDQTNPASAPNYAALAAQQRELTSYTTTLSHAVTPGCAVFQLPVVAYPEEPPPGTMGDYDHLLPSDAAPASLRWSYGAIRGTSAADWQLALPIGDQAALLRDLAAAGFCAVEIDHDGYAGSTDPGPATQALLGAPVARAAQAHLDAYSLQPVRDRLPTGASLAAARDEVLHPVLASLTGSLVDESGGRLGQWTGPQASILAANLGTTPVPVTVTMTVAGNGPSPRRVSVGSAGTATQTVVVEPGQPRTVSLALTLRPGTTTITVSTDGAVAPVPETDLSRYAALRVSDLTVTTSAAVNAASQQQFAAASPASRR